MNENWRRFALASLCLTLGLASLSALAQGSWKPGAPIPQGANEVIGANVGGYVLVYGGQDPANKPMGLFWKFDPAANQWTQLPSNTAPRPRPTTSSTCSAAFGCPTPARSAGIRRTRPGCSTWIKARGARSR